jgi:hypothetical protein
MVRVSPSHPYNAGRAKCLEAFSKCLESFCEVLERSTQLFIIWPVNRVYYQVSSREIKGQAGE